MKLSSSEFSQSKREKLLDYKVYTTNFDRLHSALEIVAETLAQPEPALARTSPADLMHPTYVRADLMTEFISTCYSAGHDMAFVRSLYPSLIDFWETYSKYSKAYNESTEPRGTAAHIPLADKHFHTANRIVCWGILLGYPSLLSRIPSLIDYNNPAKDGLLENLLAGYVSDRGDPPTECIRHLPYYKALKVFTASRNEQVALVNEYLDDWYAASRRETYFDSHKKRHHFSGYWCWEAAAITVALEIDDSSYRNAQFYPRDMSDFARAALRDYAPLGSPPTAPGEIRAKADDLCPKAGTWQSLDENSTTREFALYQPMSNLNSAYGLTVWQFKKSERRE
jgi:hypothetical protein